MNLNLLSSQEFATIESTKKGGIERKSVNGVKKTLEIIKTNRKFESSIVTKRVFPDTSVLYDSTIHRFTKKSQADGPFKEFIHHITLSIDQNNEIEAKSEMEKVRNSCPNCFLADSKMFATQSTCNDPTLARLRT